MKRLMGLILCMLLICSIPGVALKVETIKQTGFVTLEDDVPLWEVDDSWGV